MGRIGTKLPGRRAWQFRALRVFGAGIACVSAAAALLVVLTPAPAAAVVAITAPTSKNLGSAATGTATITAQLGTVTVTASGIVAPSFTASVSATVFTTGGKTANETIAKSSVKYWSGPATAFSGLLGNPTPGQVDAAHAQNLATSRTAFSGTGLALSISCAWNPTIIITIPASAVVGTYSGTITHSVA